MASKPTWGDFTKALTGEPHLFLHIDDDMRAGAYWGTVRFGTPDEKTDIWFLFVDREPGKVAKFVPPSDGCTLLKLSEYHAILESVSKPTAASRFSHDDRGNVVDFYDTETDEQIARLDREAEVNGFGDAIDEARRLESAGKQ